MCLLLKKKNESNKKKHGISFDEAKEVFEDTNRKEYGELRIIAIGYAKTVNVILFVVFTIPHDQAKFLKEIVPLHTHRSW